MNKVTIVREEGKRLKPCTSTSFFKINRKKWQELKEGGIVEIALTDEEVTEIKTVYGSVIKVDIKEPTDTKNEHIDFVDENDNEE